MTKALAAFPRPPQDNGIGIHLGLDLTDKRVKADLERCLYMGMKWVVVCHPSPNLVIKTARLFWDNGIMPILRFRTIINQPFEWQKYTKKAADALGLSPYIQVHNEPGDNREYKNDKRPQNWLELFITKWLKASNAVAMAGGLPGLQVLSTRELRAVLQFGFHEWGWFCPHNYACRFPPHYYNKGEGGSIGMLSFLDFADVFREVINHVPPFICGEGGEFFGSVGNKQHADWTREMFSWFRLGTLSNGQATPDYLLACCPWILSGQGCEPWYGWSIATVTIQAVQAISDFVRGESEPTWLDNSRVISAWMPEPAADLLRHDCEDVFGGKWQTERRDV